MNKIRSEIFRKSIHILGIIVPIISIYLGIWAAFGFVIVTSILYLWSEYLRIRGCMVPIFSTITKIATRANVENQEKIILSPLYLSAGILSSLLLFPEPINYAAITILVLGDGAASISGKLIGKRKIWFSREKTIEGSITGFACAFCGSLLFVSPVIALAGAITGILIEAFAIRVNDNLTVPISAGIAMVAVSYANIA